MSTVSLFFKQVLAQFKGDADVAIAAYNERKAKVAFKSQIAALEAKVIDDENAVDDAQDGLNTAMFPTVKIDNGAHYIKNLAYYNDRLENAKANLQATNKSLEFFRGLLAKEWAEVDAE